MTVHLEALVEEPSAEHALKFLLPKILGNDATFNLHSFQGKLNLLRELPRRLRGYAHWINVTNTRIVVLVDEERQDCDQLKCLLEETAAKAGLVTKSVAKPGEPFVVLNRIAIEELEAWFFSDCIALRAAYPRVPADLERRAPYRYPDRIAGGTWELGESAPECWLPSRRIAEDRGSDRYRSAHGPGAQHLAELPPVLHRVARAGGVMSRMAVAEI